MKRESVMGQLRMRWDTKGVEEEERKGNTGEGGREKAESSITNPGRGALSDRDVTVETSMEMRMEKNAWLWFLGGFY